MKKFLNSDLLRAVQLFRNTVPKTRPCFFQIALKPYYLLPIQICERNQRTQNTTCLV